ncbi:hypothetical protein M408DRAFT_29619 [Serendipita vermifera MAFF 305830]|uniref:Uncharacterized protein n=1 Tax=Serendipita vermifera MAFF 305830 TaxID=933852 RepID=A0A0C3A9P4_SERVB|nr:hypothetical protein M408DRAFT_29619 [Serendipita vermifera MAFF 305830]
MSLVLDAPKDMTKYMLKGWGFGGGFAPLSIPLLFFAHSFFLAEERLSVSSASEGDVISRASTPPTDVSPPGSPPFHLPAPTEEMIRRREQSDRASQEIGNRMLRGWTMLADECTNNSCFGIPLVRSPGPNPVKECVICGHRYVPDGSSTVLLPTPAGDTPPNETSSTPKGKPSKGPTAPGSSRSKKSPLAPAMGTERTASASTSVSLHLEQALSVLDELLLTATAAGDAQEIGTIADSITKVFAAIKASSSR